MILRRAIVALTAFLCVLLGLFTITKYGVHVNRIARETAAQPPMNMLTLDPKMHAGWSAAGTSTVFKVCKAIIGQLDAFRNNDYAEAIVYQSNTLKSHIGQPAQFRMLIQHMYPEFANYRTAQFGSAFVRPQTKTVEIPVRITGADGQTVDAIYLMELEQGQYRVGGVYGGLAVEDRPMQVKRI